MNIFVAASFSAKVDYETGKVFPDYQAWLESVLDELEQAGFDVFCSLRDDKYLINDSDPAAAFQLDMGVLQTSDALLALLDDKTSAGVQLEIGFAIARNKKVLLAHKPEDKLVYINNAACQAGQATELLLPLDVATVAVACNQG